MLRGLKKESFEFKKDEFGQEYVEMGHKEVTKNNQVLDVKEEECCGVMAAQPDDPR